MAATNNSLNTLNPYAAEFLADIFNSFEAGIADAISSFKSIKTDIIS